MMVTTVVGTAIIVIVTATIVVIVIVVVVRIRATVMAVMEVGAPVILV